MLLHGKQYLFLTAKEDLTEEEAQDRSKIGAPSSLEKAWQLKEALRTWYATATATMDAARFGCLDRAGSRERTDQLEKPFRLLKIGDKKFWPFFTFCPYSFPMVLLKARTIEPKH